MGGVFSFLCRYKSLLLFLTLEFVCVRLIILNNRYQGAFFFNSSSQVAASLLSVSKQIEDYFLLRDINEKVAEENAQLKTELARRIQPPPYRADSVVVGLAALEADSALRYISAEVINNSVHRFKNYITINQGSDAGVRPGMAVTGQGGVVGKVRSTSRRYAVVSSLLSASEYLSGVIRRTNYFGSVRWYGADPQYVFLDFIPRHARVQAGDTVVTSGFNSVFPKGIPVGVVSEVGINPGTQFYQIKVQLAEDFSRLAFVSVIASKVGSERDSLEQTTEGYSNDE